MSEFNGTSLENLVKQGNTLAREVFIGRKAINFETINTIGITALPLTKQGQAQTVKITIEKNALTTGVAARYCEDGTTPTASTGMPLWDGDTIELTNNQNISNFLIISTDANNQTISVTYYM